MASKYRVKGSYKDHLNLSASQISEMSESTLRGIVTKLNDAANKRIKRLEASGYAELSPSYRGREKAGHKLFKTTGKEKPSELRTAYLNAQHFLRPEGTSTRKGIEQYNARFDDLYKEVLGKDFNDASNFDRRYKRKKILKKSVKNKLRAFWEKYDEWREIATTKYPDLKAVDTNINNVETFEEELYNEGKVTYSQMEAAAKAEYEANEAEGLEDEGESANVPTRGTKPGSPRKAKPSKYKTSGKKSYGKTQSKNGIKQRFEKVKIL